MALGNALKKREAFRACFHRHDSSRDSCPASPESLSLLQCLHFNVASDRDDARHAQGVNSFGHVHPC